MRLKQNISKEKSAFSAASATVQQRSGMSISDNRNKVYPFQSSAKGIIQAKWYDSDGNENEGHPPEGWIRMYDKYKKIHYWIPPFDDFSESSSESEDEKDTEFKEKKTGIKNKKKDKGSEIKKGTFKRKNEDLEYETESGIKHIETVDSINNKKVTESSGLKYSGEFRNPAHRDKKMFKVFNPYKLSVGQFGQNQMVVSHNTPSWSGMQAGGDFGNYSLTSPKYNSEIEQEEKNLRLDVENSDKKFSYKTETEYEDILSDDAPEIEKAITKLYKGSKWKEERIRKRIRKVKEKYPESRRIKKEKRTMINNGKKRYFTKERDLLAYIPRRAYNKEAHEKYIEARGEDSQESDLELEDKKPKKIKKKKKMKKINNKK